MTGAVVDFVEDDEYAVIVEEPPECLVSVLHGLVGVRATQSAKRAVQASAKHC
ncbi:hypothetical protein FQZ97_864880 [compost metagenome]